MADASLDPLINRLENHADRLEGLLDSLLYSIEGTAGASATPAAVTEVSRGGTLGKVERIERTLKRTQRTAARLIEGMTGEAPNQEEDSLPGRDNAAAV